MAVIDIARTSVVTAEPDTSVAALARRMRDESVGSVVVVDRDAPVGIVTDRDVAVRVVADRVDPDTTTAADVMTESPVTVSASAGVFELTKQMDDHAVRRMPVVRGHELVGIVTLDDVVELLVGELDNLVAVIDAEAPPY